MKRGGQTSDRLCACRRAPASIPSLATHGGCSDSSTKAAECSSWFTRRLARESIAPGGWPCGNDSAAPSTSSCKRRPRTTVSTFSHRAARVSARAGVRIPQATERGTRFDAGDADRAHVQRALALERVASLAILRFQGGAKCRHHPTHALRRSAGFRVPDQVACAGKPHRRARIPDHPWSTTASTILHEAMDIEGLKRVPRGLSESGAIR